MAHNYITQTAVPTLQKKFDDQETWILSFYFDFEMTSITIFVILAFM